MDAHQPEPAIKFKRRKTTHTKRARVETDDVTTLAVPRSPDAVPTVTVSPALEEDGTSLALKEILRNRKRPRDRLREAAARAELTKTQTVVLREQDADAPRHGYTSRFVPQTGQVIDTDDQQITEYIEARQAEKNHRLYGWPIPRHLVSAVATLASDPPSPSAHTAALRLSPPTAPEARTKSEDPPDDEKARRLAAGMGKLEEIDLGPASTSRAEAAWKKLQGGSGGGGAQDQPAKVRLGRDGKPRRQPKRRNSEDIRRDAMVEAVLREAKLDYFDSAPPPSTSTTNMQTNNDEALVEQFRQEFLDSIQERQQRKPAPPARGEKEAPKGPKLGGSRSARAKMHALEEAKTSKR
ncbi:hypothetical protein DPSP01_002602 [Paraphaeosphaeria sporulosa]|uniref:Hepatocellular carcinoma-associated antigen 59-domain-containing protein n=1 Tax=Paraphaeosphaeria sporulosa TaxID=1460663 RepID=A0A177CWA4_9PLEO|nr:uncharacterized protein CC84DRAFT_1182437 [Paraphaeosphaeria sporulosa]OAG11491.1 hypothetical protein CC84DRAFT_1182437 [Paraphaeosphaeria sporulosa]